MRDELAKALIAKNGVPLSIAEHDAVVSQIKCDVAEAQAERLVALELASKSMLWNYFSCCRNYLSYLIDLRTVYRFT